MSVHGTERTSSDVRSSVAIGGTADIDEPPTINFHVVQTNSSLRLYWADQLLPICSLFWRRAF